jgi:hypothetical protein
MEPLRGANGEHATAMNREVPAFSRGGVDTRQSHPIMYVSSDTCEGAIPTMGKTQKLYLFSGMSPFEGHAGFALRMLSQVSLKDSAMVLI